MELSIEAKVEALLFVAPTSVSTKQISEALETTEKEINSAIKSLKNTYETRGLRIQQHKKKIRLTSAPECAEMIETFLSLEATSRLSQAALETLAIIAYQQPITRPKIDSIRGVNSDGVMRNLLSKGLIEEAGRSQGPGRPILFNTSPEFLQHFGLSSIADLPPIDLPENISTNEAGSDIGGATQLPLAEQILKN